MRVEIVAKNFPELVARLAAMAEATRIAGQHAIAVGTDVPYAHFVTDGTRPHLIYPSAKRALAWPGAAHPSKVVHHPGYRGNPFLTDALRDDVAPRIVAILAAMDAIAHGAPPALMEEALTANDLALLADARKRANVETGNLRDSLHIDRLGG